MALGILVLLSALSISAVAIYYSIAGLVAIFAAAAVPIMIMGTALEIGKLVTAVWLHKYWTQAKWWLKTYLAVAVAVLMFITSMGIFGYLSKAHIEQTSASIESTEKIEQLDTEINRYTNIIEKKYLKIKVRREEFLNVVSNRKPWEDLSIGFQCRIYRNPNIYNSKFWFYFTNVYISNNVLVKDKSRS